MTAEEFHNSQEIKAFKKDQKVHMAYMIYGKYLG